VRSWELGAVDGSLRAERLKERGAKSEEPGVGSGGRKLEGWRAERAGSEELGARLET